MKCVFASYAEGIKYIAHPQKGEITHSCVENATSYAHEKHLTVYPDEQFC